jgi:ribosomal protein S6--L-glutamate ligase
MMLRAAVISMGSISSKWTVDALQKHFDEVDHLDIKEFEVNLGKEGGVLYAGKPLKQYDCLYMKGSGRYANLLRTIASMLGDRAFIPIKPGAFTAGHDKLLTHIKLQKHKVPQPNTYIAATSQAAKKIIKKMTYPIVLKLPTGTHGKGVMLADSYESASSMIDALAVLKQPFLLQEYIETDSTDTRAFVVGDEVVASMKRIAVTGEKRANIHAGGRGEATTLSAQAKKIAIQAARAMGAEICGVDMLESVRGPKVIEVNVSPGLQGISKATGVQVAEKIAKYLFERTKEYKKEIESKGKAEVMREIPAPSKEMKEVISKVDFRGARLLLPEIASTVSKLAEDDEIVLKLAKGRIEIDKIRKKEEKEEKED